MNKIVTEEGKRPSHLAYSTSQEVAATAYSGLRENGLTGHVEIWLLGEKKADISPTEILINPNAIAEAHERIFATVPVIHPSKK